MFEKQSEILTILSLVMLVYFLYFINKEEEQDTDKNKESFVQGPIENILIDSVATKLSNSVQNNDTMAEQISMSSDPLNDIFKEQIIQSGEKQLNSVPIGVSTNNQYSNLDTTVMNVNFDLSSTNDAKGTLVSGDLLPSNNENEYNQYNIETTYLDANLAANGVNKLGIDTIQSSKRNASHDLRGSIPCPKFVVSPWNNSTIDPDLNIKSFY
jgi:hypothetical protein